MSNKIKKKYKIATDSNRAKSVINNLSDRSKRYLKDNLIIKYLNQVRKVDNHQGDSQFQDIQKEPILFNRNQVDALFTYEFIIMK